MIMFKLVIMVRIGEKFTHPHSSACIKVVLGAQDGIPIWRQILLLKFSFSLAVGRGGQKFCSPWAQHSLPQVISIYLFNTWLDSVTDDGRCLKNYYVVDALLPFSILSHSTSPSSWPEVSQSPLGPCSPLSPLGNFHSTAINAADNKVIPCRNSITTEENKSHRLSKTMAHFDGSSLSLFFKAHLDSSDLF